MKNYLRIAIFNLSMIGSGALYAQEKENVTYILKKTENIQDLDNYKIAISKAQLDCYRMLDQRRTLSFDNGLIVELLSAKELEKNKISVNKSCLTNPESIKNEKRTFSLNANGYLLESVTPGPTKFNSK